jgi:hypothetical protein
MTGRDAASVETTPMLPGFSSVAGKPVPVRFDGDLFSSNGELLS